MEKIEGKRFFAKIPGSRFVFSDGEEAVFAHGFCDLNELTVQGEYSVPNENQNCIHNGKPRLQVYLMELNAILGKNPNIFVPEKLPEKMELNGKIPVTTKSGRVYDTPANPGANASTEIEIQQAEAATRAAGTVRVQQQTDVPGSGMPSPVEQSTVDVDLQAAMLGATKMPPQVIGPGASKAAELRAAAAARSASVDSSL